MLIISTLIFEMRMEAAGSCIYGIREFRENHRQEYGAGTEYTKEEIDEALALGENQGRRLVPSVDISGHGTAVLGIAAGNGRASGGVNRGVAYESDLLVVKMGIPKENSFSQDNGTDPGNRLSDEEGAGTESAVGDQSEFWE